MRSLTTTDSSHGLSLSFMTSGGRSNEYKTCPAMIGRTTGSRYPQERRRTTKKVLGKKRAHRHGMRHGAAVDMAIREVALQDIQHALGHEHLSTTEIYL